LGNLLGDVPGTLLLVVIKYREGVLDGASREKFIEQNENDVPL